MKRSPNGLAEGPKGRSAKWFCSIAAILLLGSSVPVGSHPHVFVDGGVDFQISDKNELQTLRVTWLYDAFETLYMLSSHDMSLTQDGTLAEVDRLELVQRLSQWPDDFDGSVHVTAMGEDIELKWPKALDVQLVEGRLQLTFLRDLIVPLPLSEAGAEVGFYESTYFFDFTVTNAPELIGGSTSCTTDLVPFDANIGDKALLSALAKLSREETSDISNVGATFADRIMLRCEP